MIIFVNRLEMYGSMKQIFKGIFHRMKVSALLKKMEETKRDKEFHNADTMKTALIFWVANAQDTEWIKTLTKELRGVKIDKLCFVPDSFSYTLHKDVVYVRNEDLGFGGKILNTGVYPILSTPYDLLLDLSDRSSALIDYILKTSLAKCKIGKVKADFESDIMLEEVRDTRELVAGIVQVLSELKKY